MCSSYSPTHYLIPPSSLPHPSLIPPSSLPHPSLIPPSSLPHPSLIHPHPSTSPLPKPLPLPTPLPSAPPLTHTPLLTHTPPPPQTVSDDIDRKRVQDLKTVNDTLLRFALDGKLQEDLKRPLVIVALNCWGGTGSSIPEVRGVRG